ncbi:MAG: hypothetical protein US76_01845 [Parcubacteria group bacterium GW2011_GWA2_38_13b]|nr:MAG: hypothetical protein US76_01845 [Parcubacteria group bacterium GW2011_GWA2_38_13b]
MDFNKENNKEIRKLTAAVFRVTENFRGGRIIRDKIQEKALNIFAKSNPHFDNSALKDIGILNNFLNLAKDLNLTKSINCEILIVEYERVLKYIISILPEKLGSQKNIVKNNKPKVAYGNNAIKNQNEKLAASRKKIIGLFKNKDKLRMKEISKAFPDITSRTLRNHLRSLIDDGLVYNEGKGAGSVYILKS